MRTIRPLDVEKDFPHIIEIIEDIRHSELRDEAKAEIKKSLENIIKKEDSEMLICDIDDRTAGYLNYHIVEMPLVQGKEIYITELFINKEFRGQGIGSALLNHVKKIAQEKSVKRLLLNNDRELKSYETEFYKKHGFTERETMANFVLKF